ncbi:hypothetical protein [Streptomyces sp. AVP053U2]|uniref:hypothetical protein n=1 Tax=Streptomyces sp. AVP053U2 TaxID=1737066 RepID=UPI00073C8A5E|nr:hypothetical protein [Streptomyces sp. AVP053U2]ODA69500.1 hypothetical protein APS67_006304 [Streptomyces sp. AVP053U2]
MEESTQSTVSRTDSSALLMLPLPQVIGLTETQRRGAECVWCETPLTAETARDLGERPTSDGTRIWPRGCTPCVCTESRRVFSLHSRSCQRCLRSEQGCPDRRALRALALEDRRETGQ